MAAYITDVYYKKTNTENSWPTEWTARTTDGVAAPCTYARQGFVLKFTLHPNGESISKLYVNFRAKGTGSITTTLYTYLCTNDPTGASASTSTPSSYVISDNSRLAYSSSYSYTRDITHIYNLSTPITADTTYYLFFKCKTSSTTSYYVSVYDGGATAIGEASGDAFPIAHVAGDKIQFSSATALYPWGAKITYNANGGSGAPGAQIATSYVNTTLSSTKPTRAGYEFLGWATSSTATAATYSSGGTIQVTTSDITLYAVWKATKTWFNTFTSTINFGSAMSISINKPSSETAIELLYTFGSYTGTIISKQVMAANTAKIQSWTPDNTLASAIPSANSGTGTLTLNTYANASSTTILGTETKQFTLNIPSTWVPTTSALTGTVTNQYSSKAVAGQSGITFTWSGTASTGSSIKYYRLYDANGTKVYEGSTGSYTINALPASTSNYTVRYSCSVVDRRNKESTKSLYPASTTLTVYGHAVPVITTFEVERKTSPATDAIVTISVSHTSTVGDSLTYTVGSRAKNSTGAFQSVTCPSGSWGNGSFTISGWSDTASYEFQLAVADPLMSTPVTSNATLSTKNVTMDFREGGQGVAIGKISEKNAFEVGMESEFYEQVTEKRGHIVHSVTVGGGTAGWNRVARIQIVGTYANQPIGITYLRRNDMRPYMVTLTFKNKDALDPEILYFRSTNPTKEYIHSVSSGIWDLYIQKTESYDQTNIVDLKFGPYMKNKVNITWVNEAPVATVPANTGGDYFSTPYDQSAYTLSVKGGAGFESTATFASTVGFNGVVDFNSNININSSTNTYSQGYFEHSGGNFVLQENGSNFMYVRRGILFDAGQAKEVFWPDKGIYARRPSDGAWIDIFRPISASSGDVIIGYGNYANVDGTTYHGVQIYGGDIKHYIRNAGTEGANYRPYYRKGDSIHITPSVHLVGYESNSAKNVYFTIPLDKPIIGNPTVTITHASGEGFVVRRNAGYNYGSAAGIPVTPSSYEYTTATPCGIRISAAMRNTTNASSNSVCGVEFTGTITFS